MLRILFLLLAVISAALAVILDMMWLLGIAGALVVILLVAWLMHARKRSQGSDKTSPSQVSREQELASLGISEVRARGAADAPPAAAERPAQTPVQQRDPAPPPETDAPAEVEQHEGVRPATVQRIGTRRKAHGAAFGEDRFSLITAPYLQSLRAAIGAQTVVLLKQEDIEPHYQIEVIVSQNSYARSGGNFSTREPLVTGTAQREVMVHNVGAGGIDPASLGYYREPIKVRQVALAPVPPSGDSAAYLLLADSMNDTDLREPYRQGLLAQFAGLLRSILDMIELEGKLDASGETARPRREIIEEEMERARAEGSELMFALIHLNDAEQIASGGRIAVAAAERALEAALKKSADDRVERFGELTYGVFHDADEVDAEAWAQDLQERLEAGRGALKGGASIGIAVLRDRHETADMYRDDATEALREAYETGTCTIVE